MNDRELKNMLVSYVGEEMALIREKELPGYDHVYSRPYQKRIRRMFWSEKYFGSRIFVGYAVRRIVVFAIIIISLFVANEVSAKVFGFDPWKYVTSFLNDSKMDKKMYTGFVGEDGASEGAVTVVARDVPTALPEGFEQTAFKQDEEHLYAEWQKEDRYLLYNREKLSVGMSMAIDGEYESKESITVHGFVGDYCIKGDEAWIVWDDATYNHAILATGVENPKEILGRMAESLYE